MIYMIIIIIMALEPFVWALAVCLASGSHTQSVALLIWGISPSQGRYLHTAKYKHRIQGNTE
jgi:hypothetical protein